MVETENFTMVEVETLKLEKEVLVKVKSFSVNPIDYLVRSGLAMKDLYNDLSPRNIGWISQTLLNS